MIAERIEFRLVVLACLWAALSAGPCFAVKRHPDLARKAYQHAVELQRKLEAKPDSQRTVAEYKRAIREFRKVYYYDFAYSKAPVAAQTMGDLYVEMGRRFHEPAYFKSAIKYYQFVTSQYPVTSMAREAAMTVGNIYLEDLNDPEQAADAYRAFLDKHPRSAQSSEARKRLKEIADLQAAQKEQPSARSRTAEVSSEPAARPKGGPVQVTEIHNWVGPSYTRVVIEAKGPFQYNTLRLSHPDRIVFDLTNARVSHAMQQKSVPVDGAFLRDIRVGQFKPNVTRVVLDVKNINDYSAFSLPNPFRLIIDVHGLPSETTKNTAEHGRADSPSAAKAGRTEQASVEKLPAAVKRAPIARSNSEVEAAPKAEEVAKQKTSPAIEYEDQQAVMAKAEMEHSREVAQTAKAKTQSASDGHATEAVKPKTETAPAHQAKETAKPKAETASNQPDPKTSKPKSEVESIKTQKNASAKTEIASKHHTQQAARKDVKTASAEARHDPVPVSTKPAAPTEDGSQTLTRALGLKVARIVIDPGHGGFDTGTIGPTGLEEKNVVLDIGLRLRKLFETRTDSEVFMTRSTDKFIPLEERTAIANEDRADLFISIHANASRDHRVRGIETYFLNFTSDPEALRLAARENATSQESVHQLQNLIKKIALNNKIEESQELARDIQTVLYKRVSRVSRGVHNRGVRKAPFVVLIGANMPSVLTEISFLSNPHSERLLRSPAYREQIAKAIFTGIEDYIHNLGSVRVAQRTQ